jgi:hypothetical protein
VDVDRDCPSLDSIHPIPARGIERLRESTECPFFKGNRGGVHSQGHGELTPYWAQEAVGSDLADRAILAHDSDIPGCGPRRCRSGSSTWG